MYIDYEFYKNNGGNLISEDDFERYAEKAENTVSIYTFDRVNDITINRFPPLLVSKIKKCACELADLYFEIDKVNKKYINAISDEKSSGIVKSETAGAVSKTYENVSVAEKLLNSATVNLKIGNVINFWLYPCMIDGKYYNITSWVV